MISFDSVSKRYPGNREALSGVTFSVDDGEMIFITGHSGAGKSTLLKLIPAIERPTSGSVVVQGQNISAMKASALPYLRRSIGVVFQDQKLLHDRNVYENVMLPLAFSDHPPKEAARRARAALDKVGLRDRELSHPIQLSGGEQQRLAIARAVVNRPSILIADEPTANLDDDSARIVMEIFLSFHQVGVTILLASHDQAMMRRYGGRVFELAGGQLQERSAETTE